VFKLNRYPAAVVLLLAGMLTVVLAYATLNLFQVSMANIRFLREFGWIAIEEGGLLQLAQLIFCAIVAMLSYIGFKICEIELVHRYHDWQNR
jgi:hypothetical protein